MSGLVASTYGLMAVLKDKDQKLFIYNHGRCNVLKCPLNCPVLNQMAFDIYITTFSLPMLSRMSYFI